MKKVYSLTKYPAGLRFHISIYEMDTCYYVCCEDSEEVHKEMRHFFHTYEAAHYYVMRFQIPEWIYKDDFRYEMCGC